MDALTAVARRLYQTEVALVSGMQDKFPDSGSFFMTVSGIGDPRYTFTITFPLVYALSWSVGAKLLGVLVVVEWVNMILKWLTHGHRPYWWVNETGVYESGDPPYLRQFPITCETGPGMPSGHLMVAASTCYIIVDSFLGRVIRRSMSLSDAQKQLITRILWTIYFSWLGLVTLSRIYIAAHFSHQCITGAVLGLTIARFMNANTKWLYHQRHYYVSATAAIYLSAIGTYSLLLFAGWDPLWSVASAVKWCVRSDYIHIETLPFYSMMRYCGASLGLGIGLTSKYFKQTDRTRFTSVMKFVAVVLCLFVAKMADYVHIGIPKHNQMVFYTSEFILNSTFPYLIVAVVPYIISLSSGISTMGKYKRP